MWGVSQGNSKPIGGSRFKQTNLEVNNLPGLSASAWSDCGTTGCVAGHTSAVAVELGLFPPTSKLMDVDDMARKALKLTEKRADWLFEADRSLGEVKTALNLIISGKSKKIHKSTEEWI